MKSLAMEVDQHVTQEEHVANVIKSSYDTLQSLKLLKRYSPYKQNISRSIDTMEN